MKNYKFSNSYISNANVSPHLLDTFWSGSGKLQEPFFRGLPLPGPVFPRLFGVAPANGGRVHSLPCSRWHLGVMVFPVQTVQGQVLEGNIWLHHASARAVESANRQLGSRVLEVFPWWSPSGKLSFAPRWQNAPPPRNSSMGTAGKEWHIKVWAPWLPHVPLVRQFPGHSGQGQAIIPPVLRTGQQPGRLAAFSPP